VRELSIESNNGLPDRRERVRYWMRMGESVRGALLTSSGLREAAATYEAPDPVPLAEEAPSPFDGHALRYPVESAVALDRANALIDEMRDRRMRLAEAAGAAGA
jgi:hypothetical protein